MNAAEHIVDCYYRMVEKCFTMSDAKVPGGVNRQLDLLAVNLKTNTQYHIETSVTHRKGWAPNATDLEKVFSKKFLGLPEKRSGAKTDSARGKNYKKNIEDTYKLYGFEPKKVNRIFVCWITHPSCDVESFKKEFQTKHKFNVSVVSFRDEIMPKLRKVVGTANYDDEILRTIAFIKEYDLQIKTKC